MTIQKLGIFSAGMAVGMTILGSSFSSAQAAVFFGEDLQHFAKGQVTDAPDLGTLQNSATAEQAFLAALEDAHASLNFEQSEGFTQLGKTGDAFSYTMSLDKSDGGVFDMTISDSNSGPNYLHTSIEDTKDDVKGGRYGISEAGSTAQERKDNQFLNTNAGKDSNLTFTFSEATSAFGFYGTDFERGGVMGVEFTRLDGSTEYVSLGLSDPDDFDKTIRGTAFYFGYTAETKAEQFTQVRFDVSDSTKGTNDMVAFDRMTFASGSLNAETQEVPEPAAGLLALGTFAVGAALKKRQQRLG
ncbi:MAG: hypothetical protein AAFP20_17450 [Cyanobacteria bacterium J06614_10]